MVAGRRAGPAVTRHAAAVLVAMDEEAAPFLDLADEVGDARRVGFAQHRDLTVSGLPVLLVRTGIGMVNASSAATAVLLGGPDAPGVLVSAGTAGGLGAGVIVADVVVGSEYVLLDADVRPFGYERGQVPGMPARHGADPGLLAAARAARVEGTLHVGLMASGDSFMTPLRSEAALADFPPLLSADMETSAIAQIAHTHGARFLSVRGVSDLCDPVAAASFTSNAPEAARRSAEVVVQALHGSARG